MVLFVVTFFGSVGFIRFSFFLEERMKSNQNNLFPIYIVLGEESSEEGPVDLPKGKTVAQRFLILEKLGEGGCGAVYKVSFLHFF